MVTHIGKWKCTGCGDTMDNPLGHTCIATTQQQLPVKGKQNVLEEIKKDLDLRTEFGIKKYGTPLQTHNGRDALVDAYQEALDLCQYLKQTIMERDDNKNIKEKDLQAFIQKILPSMTE